MIRIDTSRDEAGRFELAVSGALEGAAVATVGDELSRAKSPDSAVTLNLMGLTSADRAGCDALLDWVIDGVTLKDCPAFLRRWMLAEQASRIRERSRIRDASSRIRGTTMALALAAALAGATPGQAAGDPPPGAAASLTFSDARARMMTANETALAAGESVTERRDERAAMKGFYWPRVELHAQATHLNDDVILDLNPIRDVISSLHRLPPALLPSFETTFQKQDYWLSSLTVTWPIYTGGKVQAANKAAAFQVTDAEQARRQTDGALSSELARRYFALRLALRARDVRAQVLEGLATHVVHATALEREGQIARVERLHAEVARRDAERQLRSSEHDVALARTALASLLSSDALVDPATGLFITGSVEPLDVFVARALKNNPGLGRLESQRGRASEAVRAEKGAWLPTVAAFGMRELHTDDLTIVSPTWAVGVTATFTLFDGMERGHRVAAARSQEKRVGLLRERARRDIATLVEQKYRAMEKAREEFASLDTTLELAAEVVRARTRAFEEGMGTSLEVVDARLALQGLQLQRLAAAYAFDVALAELLEAAGDADQFETLRAQSEVDPEK
jgi:outer membrane protein TolC